MGEWMVQRLKRAYSCKANVFEPYESCFRAMFLGQASSVAHPRGTAKDALYTIKMDVLYLISSSFFIVTHFAHSGRTSLS